MYISGSPIIEGIRGTRNVLKGAVSKYHSPTYHEYVKTGGFEVALKDFRALKPRNVKTDVHDNLVSQMLADRLYK